MNFLAWWKALFAPRGSGSGSYDPKVKIQQAIEGAQRQHQAMSQIAASVIGHEREIKKKIGRQLEDIDNLRAAIAQCRVQIDGVESEIERARYRNSARNYAAQLEGAEANLDSLTATHQKSEVEAQRAKWEVERNAVSLQRLLSDRSVLLTRIDQYRMQSRMSERSVGSFEATAEDGSLDKVKRLYADALSYEFRRGAEQSPGGAVRRDRGERLLELRAASRRRASDREG